MMQHHDADDLTLLIDKVRLRDAQAYGDPCMPRCPAPGCTGRLRWRYRASGPNPHRPPFERYISCEMCWYAPPMKAERV